MPQLGNIGNRIGFDAKLVQQGIVGQIGRRILTIWRPAKQAVRVEVSKDFPAFRLLAQLIQAHGIEAFEDVPVITMLGHAAMFGDKPLDVFEPGNDPLLPGRQRPLHLGRSIDAKLGQQFKIAQISHRRQPCWRGAGDRRRPPPSGVPRHPAMSATAGGPARA